MPTQLALFAPPVIERAATIPADVVFHYAGRPLRVHRIYGTDARAPVIVEELVPFGTTLKGQFALWSYDAVARAIGGKPPCR
jgi:hypothetical protein